MIFNNIAFSPRLLLVLEPSIWNVQIEVGHWLDWWISPKEKFPMIINKFLNWSESDVHHGKIFVGLGIPQNLDFFSLGVGDDLSGDENLVREIEYIETQVIGQVGKINLFLRSQSQFNNMFALFSSNTWDSSHQFIDIHLAVVEISSDRTVIPDISEIFHGVTSVKAWEWSGFSDWVDMSNVSNWSSWDGVD